MEGINFIVVLIVSIVAFIAAPIWFGPLFGKLWMKIHGWENMSKQELKKQEEGIWKLLVIEFINTCITMSVLAFLIIKVPGYKEMALAFFVWIGFSFPSIVSSIIWGADKKEYHITKISLLAGFNLIILLGSACIFSIWL